MSQTIGTHREGTTGRGPLWVAATLLIASAALAACGGGGGDGTPAPGGGGGNPAATTFPGTGSGGQGFLTVDSVFVNEDRHFVVEFTMESDGVPLFMSDLDRSRIRWVFGWVDEQTFTDPPNPDVVRSRYQSYIVNTVTGVLWPRGGSNPPALPSATQAGSETAAVPASSADGTLQDLGLGSYRYISQVLLPEGFDADARHTLAGYAETAATEEVSNPVVHFIPSGGPLVGSREVVVTANCNECHQRLAIHGGVRQEVGLCQICHTDQTVDPESGNSVEFEQMIHKIHYGANLEDPIPYAIVGFRESVHDYSEVHFPQDVRNCTKCHKNGAESENWRRSPGRRACGSCHDDVDFSNGANHMGGPQSSDNTCANCHGPVEVFEFDATVPGAHVVPYTSALNPGLTLVINDVRNLKAGLTPEVDFMISDNLGPVDITTLQLVSIAFAGSTDDYTSLISTRNRYSIKGFGPPDGVLIGAAGTYTWTSPDPIEAGATDTWAVGMEARTNGILVDGTSVNFGANNPVVYVDTTTATGNLLDPLAAPVARREVVNESKCSSCHDDLVFHGNLRTNLEYCVMCHNKWATDEGRRGVPSDPNGPVHALTNPPESISFEYMIHKIHRGHDLENGYTVWGFAPFPDNGVAHDFTEIHFPGDTRNCATCHLDGTNEFPLATENRALVFNIAGAFLGGPGQMPTSVDAPIRPPTVAACTACHDDDATLAHAMLNVLGTPLTDPADVWFEACSTCHGVDAEFEPHK